MSKQRTRISNVSRLGVLCGFSTCCKRVDVAALNLGCEPPASECSPLGRIGGSPTGRAAHRNISLTRERVNLQPKTDPHQRLPVNWPTHQPLSTTPQQLDQPQDEKNRKNDTAHFFASSEFPRGHYFIQRRAIVLVSISAEPDPRPFQFLLAIGRF